MTNNQKILAIVLTLLVATTPSAVLANNSMNIRNNVSASSNTGGNSGRSVSTGNASAKSSVEANVSSGKSGTISVDAKAEANDKRTEVEINSTGDEPVSISKEITDGQNKATIDVEINTSENHIGCDNKKEKEYVGVCTTSTVKAGDSENENIISRIGWGIKLAVSSIVNRIISIFS